MDNQTLRLIGVGIACTMIGMAINVASAKGKEAPRPMVENLKSFVSFAGLTLGCFFWSFYWWDHFHPELVDGAQTYAMWVLVALFGICQPLGLPLMIATVFPREPFTLHLHTKTIKTDAYKIQLYTLVVMGVISFVMVWNWIGTALGQTDLFDRFSSTIMFVALAVMLPSFSMLHVIPQDWKLQLEIAEKLEKARRRAHVEEALVEAQLAQAIVLMAAEPLQMALDQRQANNRQAAEILGMIFVRVNAALRTLGKTLALLTNNQAIRIDTPEDRELYEGFYKLFDIVEDKLRLGIDPVPQDVAPSHAITTTATRMRDLPREAAKQIVDAAFDKVEQEGLKSIQRLVQKGRQ